MLVLNASRLRTCSYLAVGNCCGTPPGPSGVRFVVLALELNCVSFISTIVRDWKGGRATPSLLALLVWAGSGDAGYRPTQSMLPMLAHVSQKPTYEQKAKTHTTLHDSFWCQNKTCRFDTQPSPPSTHAPDPSYVYSHSKLRRHAQIISNKQTMQICMSCSGTRTRHADLDPHRHHPAHLLHNSASPHDYLLGKLF